MKNTRFFIWFPALLFLSACSCSTEGSIQQILGRSAQAPVFMDCRPVSSAEITFKFSQPVRVVSLNFDPVLEIGSIEEGQEVKVTFTRPLEAGKKFTADILVEDSDRNTLNVIIPFRARNDRMPALVFNELRTDYSKPRVEFVEFFTLEKGNLGAMRLFIAGYSLSKPVYEFSPIEVKAKEYIVLHLRTTEEGCVDETGQDLSLSAGTDALKDARDLWIPGSTKLLHRTDALWLVDQDDRIIDAVLLSENSGAEWNAKDKDIATAAEFLGRKGAWLPLSGDRPDENWFPSPDFAIVSTGTSPTRSICRDENLPFASRAGNWYITANSSNTPGKPNNPKRYVQ